MTALLAWANAPLAVTARQNNAIAGMRIRRILESPLLVDPAWNDYETRREIVAPGLILN
jgi:hypothetical protein